jgi:hypothetical protein
VAAELETAQQWIDRQFYDIKAKIMTAPVYEAYRRGRVHWTEIVTEKSERYPAGVRRVASQQKILAMKGKCGGK